MIPSKAAWMDLAREIYFVSWTLFKLMIAVLIVVKIVQELGAIVWISGLLQPFMGWVGLPESMGLVWATTLLVNIYGGMLIFFQLAPQESLTVAQVTVLGVLMLKKWELIRISSVLPGNCMVIESTAAPLRILLPNLSGVFYVQ